MAGRVGEYSMSLIDEKTGREIFYHRSYWVKYGTKIRCGNSWYVAVDQEINWWADLARLEVVK